MFEQTGIAVAESEWLGEPLPGEDGYAALEVYQGQQEAFWSAVSRGEIAVGGLPGLAASRTEAGLLEAGRRAERRVAAAEGEKLAAVAQFALRQIANPELGYDQTAMMRSVEAQVAFAFQVSKPEAADLLDLAMALTRRLPRTFAALQDGELGLRKVRVIAEESLNLTVEQCAELEQAVLPEAPQRTARSLREKTRREVERLDADAVRKRREAAREERCLYLKDEPDGMATVCAYLPVEQARAIIAAVNARIPAQRPSRDDARRIGARRLDELVDVLGAAFGVDLQAVAATDIPAPTAEQITRLNAGAETYTPSAAMKAAIRARDKHCRFPGCRRPAIHCDVDHTRAFGLKTGGRTVYTNLGCVCRFHHQVKQMPGWHCAQDEHGTFTWIDPGRRCFITRAPPPGEPEPAEFWAPEDTGTTFPF